MMKRNGSEMSRQVMELPISRAARERYAYGESLCSVIGDAVRSEYLATQILAEKMNGGRDLLAHPEQAVRAGQLNAVGLIGALLHYIAALYRRTANPGSLRKAVACIEERLGRESVEALLDRFANDFPPMGVYRGERPARAHLQASAEGVRNRELACESLLMLFLSNDNPAFVPYRELFDDGVLGRETPYAEAVRLMREFYATQEVFGPERLPLVELLKAPAVASPRSLEGQLAYIRDRWRHLLPPGLLNRLLLATDILQEETRMRFEGPGPIERPDMKAGLEAAGELGAYERFSKDSAWMPLVVLLAKNVYVWLDQLSKKHGRSITRLDEIPDEEFGTMQRWGFTGLWLIGMWERSTASRKIKQACGNPEAASSAYSLYDYVIATDLGGEAAFQDLRQRAWRHGIRLSSDMVPNHMGICSKWVTEHPEWFIQTPHPPFPRYSFTGIELSDDHRVSIRIEDGYWSRRDAAVVFKRADRATGGERYIYHGNDGTSMPWNDTAQLDFLKAEVREAVIQTILHVARKFPIIRFDAAMVLTRFHFQRLWYPPPGAGGAIPSRAGRGLTPDEFDRLFPREFWREVVDRVASELPDTLLLAEAFWMLEGYFVRTLGMHRVYNSAFMNMLKMEMNSEYRRVMKEVLEFDPEILKRFVNFMNNPDEATAVAQFGRGDKYFGVCAMMVTMPGLPLFGHGQIEGLSERYGMEYRRAYWNEPPDSYIVRRHEAEIFPLMKKRYLFSDVANFCLYDFFMDNGAVNEDVFAYSNKHENERALVVYHNRFNSISGWIRTTVARAVKKQEGGKRLAQSDLARGLGLRGKDDDYCIFRDITSGLQYVRRSRELAEKGLHLILHAYQYHVFMDFREVCARHDGALARLERSLGGRGIPSVDEALKDLYLEPVHRPLAGVLCEERLGELLSLGREGAARRIGEGIKSSLLPPLKELAEAVARFCGTVAWSNVPAYQARIIRALLLIFGGGGEDVRAKEDETSRARSYLLSGLRREGEAPLVFWGVALAWAVVHPLGRISRSRDRGEQSAAWMDEWRLGRVIARWIQSLGCDGERAWRETRLIKIVTRHQDWWRRSRGDLPGSLKRLFSDHDVQNHLEFNQFGGSLWMNKERFEDLIYWLFTVSAARGAAGARSRAAALSSVEEESFREAMLLAEAGRAAGYRVEETLTLLSGPGVKSGKKEGRPSRVRKAKKRTPARRRRGKTSADT